MADIKSAEERSRNMAKIRSRDTKPEIWLRKQLFSLGYRYRKNTNAVPGHPDLWLAKYNTAVFVHGCFWHRHAGCKYAYMPKSHIEFWEEKFQRNIQRDQVVEEQLAEKQIRMAVVWECTINRARKDDELQSLLLDRLQAFLKSDEMVLEL